MIEGNGIRLRTIRKSELNVIYELGMDYSDAGEFMPVSLTSEADFHAEFEVTGFWRDTCGKLVIENSEGDLVGEIGCFGVTHYIDGREVYFRIYSGHRRKGYAKEALRVFVNFFFESSQMNRLQAVTVAGNDVSAAMLNNEGFQNEGTLRGARWFKGHLVDLNLYSMLREDWAHNR